MTQPDTRADRQHARRTARREANRSEILDAAEVVFAHAGIHNASIRDIAAEAGFSPAAVYLFFDNRQHLLAETLTRRGDELNDRIAATIASTPDSLQALHAIIDTTVEFFTRRAHFQQVLRELRGGLTIIGPALAQYADDVDQRLGRAQDLLASVMTAGQSAGTIRAGDPLVLAQLYMVLVNEIVYLRAQPEIDYPIADFHDLVDGALRRRSATRARKRGAHTGG
jgi:AcrR family transcriptional regulator